jgi:alpha-mannosidase
MKILLLTIFVSLVAFKVFAQEPDKPNTELKEIVIVFKTHFDNGYTDYSESVIQKYSSDLMENALTLLDKSNSMPPEQRFVWTIPAWPMTQILQRCSPELKPRIEDAVKSGRFAIHSLPFTFETEASEPERLVRYFEFSSAIARKYGLELPRDAKLTDVPSHSWIIPTLLTNAGIKMLHIGCNAASQSPEVPLIFWWVGPDNSKLLTIYWGKYYGTSITPPEGWKHKSWLAIIHTNDNQGPPTQEEVDKVLADAHRLAPNAKIKIGRISDFYDAIIQENPDIPEIKGDMPDTWIHGFASMPVELKNSRNASVNLSLLESFNTTYNLLVPQKFEITAMLDHVYENLGLFDEHTFGMAMSHGHSGAWSYGDDFVRNRSTGVYKPIEDSWKEKGDRVYSAEKILIPTLNKQMDLFARQIDVAGKRIVVFNDLPWIRSGFVTIQASSDWNTMKAIKDVASGKIINVSNQSNIITFFAEDIPSMGYRTYTTVNAADVTASSLSVSEKEGTIENEFVRVKIDPITGKALSIKDKKTGQEMVKQTSEYGFGQYVYEKFSKEQVEKYASDYIKNKENTWGWAHDELGRPGLNDDTYQKLSGANPEIRYFKNEFSAQVYIHFKRGNGTPHDYSITYILNDKSKFVEINWAIEGKDAQPWPEAGWISLPFNTEKPTFELGRTGGIVNPARDFIKGSNFDYCFLNTGMAVVDKSGISFGMCSPDAPGISLDRPGLWKFSGWFVPEKPNVFVNLYNNQWSTNFTEWIEGSWSTRIYVWFGGQYESESSLVTPAAEIRSPLKAVIASGYEGKLPVSGSSIQLSVKGIAVSAFVANPDGAGHILRLWEQAGTDKTVTVNFLPAFGFKTAQPCNLRGEKTGDEFPIIHDSFEVKIKGNQPLSFILK